MKKILFLDDDPDRIRRFCQMLDSISPLPWLAICSIASECINILRTYQFDVLFLDYDLNMNRDIAITGTGMDVVDYIDRVIDRDRWPGNIIIHSHNTDYAPLMEENLKIAGHPNVTRIEFPSFFSKTDKEFNDLLVKLIKE